MQATVQLLEVITSFIQAVAWPLVVVFILIYFGAPLKKFLENVGEFSFKAGASGLEATAKRRQIEAAAMLGAASSKRSGDSAAIVDPDVAREIADVVGQMSAPQMTRRLAASSALWLDSDPADSVYERKAMETLGIPLTVTATAEDALQKLKSGKYEVVIADMRQPAGRRAGTMLRKAMQEQGLRIPFIGYTDAAFRLREAGVEEDTFGNADDPGRLFHLVAHAIESQTSL